MPLNMPDDAQMITGVWPPSRQQVEDNELTTDVLLTRWRSLMASERRAFCWDLSSMRQAVLGSQVWNASACWLSVRMLTVSGPSLVCQQYVLA